ncbi:MAG: peptidylprolyl isomerase [Elusimicrobiota bacterium]
MIGGSAGIIRKGSHATIRYTLTVDGRAVAGTSGKDPVTYIQGSGEILPGLEERLAGMKAGETKTVLLPPEQGYGRRDPKALKRIPKKEFLNPGALRIGSAVSVPRVGGLDRATVVALGPGDVTVDLNHPLAGKSLRFDVEVVEVYTPRL